MATVPIEVKMLFTNVPNGVKQESFDLQNFYHDGKECTIEVSNFMCHAKFKSIVVIDYRVSTGHKPDDEEGANAEGSTIEKSAIHELRHTYDGSIVDGNRITAEVWTKELWDRAVESAKKSEKEPVGKRLMDFATNTLPTAFSAAFSSNKRTRTDDK